MLVKLLHNYNRADVIEIFEDFLRDHNLLDDTFMGWLEDRQLQEQRSKDLEE